MWRGEFAFEPHAVRYRGGVGDNAFHAHFALQVVQGTGTPISVVTLNGVVTGPVVIIGSLVRHRLPRNDDAVIRWIEPSSAEGLALAARQTAPIMILHAPAPARPTLALETTVRIAIEHIAAGHRSLTSTADDIGISPHHLRRAAHAALGGSLRAWTVWQKLRRAALAIVDGVPLAQAAVDGGFADQAHLNRTMRAMFGITPGAFRSAAHGRVERDAPGQS